MNRRVRTRTHGGVGSRRLTPPLTRSHLAAWPGRQRFPLLIFKRFARAKCLFVSFSPLEPDVFFTASVMKMKRLEVPSYHQFFSPLVRYPPEAFSPSHHQEPFEDFCDCLAFKKTSSILLIIQMIFALVFLVLKPTQTHHNWRIEKMPTAPIKFLDQSSLKICFTDKLVTAYGGFSVLAKLFEKIKLRGSLEKIIPFAEISPNGTGGYAKILRFALTVIAGGSRFTHSAFLGDSIEIYQETFGVRRIPRSVSALTRFFLRFSSWQVVERFSDGLWSYVFAQIIPFGLIREDHLTFDSTVITRHGTQQGSKVGYNPQKRGRPSHHPILAFLNRSKYIVNLWNRSGNTSSGNGIVEFVKQTTSRLGGRIKILGCLADSGFYDIGFIQYLADNSAYLKMTNVIQIIATDFMSPQKWSRR